MYTARKLCLSLAMALAPTLVLAEPIATIKKLSGDVSIIRGTDTIPAALGGRVHRSDQIATGEQGRIGLLFDDDTRLAVGPDSTLSLADYAYDPRTHNGGLGLQVEAGTLSLIGGKLAEHNPDALQVSSPATSVIVSGSSFSVRIDKSKEKGNVQ